MATLEEVEAIKPVAHKFFLDKGLDVAVGISQADWPTRLKNPSLWLPTIFPSMAKDYVLAVRFEKKPSFKVPSHIEGVPVDYLIIGTIVAY